MQVQRGLRRGDPHSCYDLTEQLFKKGQIKEADLLAVKANVCKAELQVKEAKQAKIKANRAARADA